MSYSSPPILELAFFRKSNFKRFTNPDHVFVINNWCNGPPTLSLSEDMDDVHWFIYDETKVDWGSYYENFAAPELFHNRILGFCLLMIGLFIQKDKDIIMVAKSFSERIVNEKGFFDIYKELSNRQIEYLLGMAKERFSGNYSVLSYCSQIDMIQDIQKETYGMPFLQFRYHSIGEFL